MSKNRSKSGTRRVFSGHLRLFSRNESRARELALRIAADTRWSRADENEKRMGESQLAAASWVGCANSLADALRRLEFDLARYQDWIARFAADFLCGHPFSARNLCSFGRLGWASAPVAAAPLRLRSAGFYWRFNVRGKLRTAFLGRTARFIRAGGRIAGDHPDLRHALRASLASR